MSVTLRQNIRCSQREADSSVRIQAHAHARRKPASTRRAMSKLKSLKSATENDAVFRSTFPISVKKAMLQLQFITLVQQKPFNAMQLIIKENYTILVVCTYCFLYNYQKYQYFKIWSIKGSFRWRKCVIRRNLVL